MANKIDAEINLKGEICPYPFVKTKLALEKMESGKVLRVVGDYGPSMENVTGSLEHEGHYILKVGRINDTDWEIVVRKK